MRISTEDRRRVSDAIREAEQTTSGEFVCVLARSASTYRFYPLAWAALVGLIVPWPLVTLTAWPVQEILIAQLLAFIVVFMIAALPALRGLFVPRSVQRAAAHRAAAEQFLIRGLSRTPHARGILLYVAHEEHYARILADDGAADGVPADQWKQAITLLMAESRAGRHADGFIAALRHCAALMAQAFPAEAAQSNLLSDKFHVLD